MKRISAGFLASSIVSLSVGATSIGLGVAGANATIESFERVMTGPNLEQSPSTNVAGPGSRRAMCLPPAYP